MITDQPRPKDVISLPHSPFALPDRLAAKADPALIADDEAQLDAVATSTEASIADLTERLVVLRRAAVRGGQGALDRDQAIHRTTARLRTLRRFGLDLCLGRMVRADGESVYIGRQGLADADGRRLLIDWRSPAAEPFFGATHADPMGLASRRRYRWTNARITDYWDEVFTADGLEGHAALDDQSAFIASLGSARSPVMRDVLATIQADQDAIIRAGSAGALVVDGGPGTGKTVVALHRAAYLLYADPRLGHHRGGVLFIGPHAAYLAYVADVLPSLGEEGVRTCTVRDLLPEGASARPETDPAVAALKESVELVRGIEAGVRFYEQPPNEVTKSETPWGNITIDAADWAEAFSVIEPGTPHNEARELIWTELTAIVADKFDAEIPLDEVRGALDRDRRPRTVLNTAWPLLDASDLVADLWSVPAYLRLCAPWLTRDEIRLLQRADASTWTVADLPLLDAARHRLGEPAADVRARLRRAAVDARRLRFADIVEDLIEGDDSEMGVMSMLRGDDLRSALLEESAPIIDPDALAGPFAHVVVDEAQELTDAQWQMLLQRCPSRSFTIVGDRAQARLGFTESWRERLHRIGLDRVEISALTVNYRTPSEVMAVAEPTIRAALPDASVPTSIRDTGIPVRYGRTDERDALIDAWREANEDGIACVIGDPGYQSNERVRSMTAELAKGLEFDLVVLVEPESFGPGVTGAVDRYVAMTRTTRELVVLTRDGARFEA